MFFNNSRSTVVSYNRLESKSVGCSARLLCFSTILTTDNKPIVSILKNIDILVALLWLTCFLKIVYNTKAGQLS